ncbi:MAG: D-alanyl-D-alanine carboxypeptidase family protein [Nitrospirota bacterium]|nr:D-alanyl-D-alanine carboxypeptidase family protein [Nitrospirota bacterium]
MKKIIASVLFAFIPLTVCLTLSVSIAFGEEIKARAAVVMEAETGRVLFAKNPELRLFPASTTKLMTALVVLDHMQPDAVVIVSKRAAAASATKIGLRQGDTITISALLHAALIRSANDAAIALAEAVAGSEEAFVELMNRKAVSLGLYNTRFINPNGLPGTGQYTTALELAVMMREAVRQPLLKEILTTRVADVSTIEGRTKTITNTNHFLWSDRELMLGKTGYTREAGHCFVGAGDWGSGQLVVALLGEPVRGLLWSEAGSLMNLGERVINGLEEPVVYLTSLDYDAVKVKRASASVKKQKIRKSRITKKRSDF